MAACWEVCLCVVADFPLLVANSQRNWTLFAFQQTPLAQQHHTGVSDHAACYTQLSDQLLVTVLSFFFFYTINKKKNYIYFRGASVQITHGSGLSRFYGHGFGTVRYVLRSGEKRTNKNKENKNK